MRRSDIAFTISRVISDGVMIFLAWILAYYLRMVWYDFFSLPTPTYYVLEQFQRDALRITIFVVFIFVINGRYKFYADEKFLEEILKVFWSFSTGMALILVYFFFIQHSFFSRFIFGTAWFSGFTFILIGRIVLRGIRKFFYRLGYGRERLFILGNKSIARETIRFLRTIPKYDIIGVFTDHPSKNKNFEGIQILGTFEDLEAQLEDLKPDEVLLAQENATERLTDKLVRMAHIHHAKFRFLPDELGLDLAAVKISMLGDFPVVMLENTKMEGWSYVVKSFLDFVLATIILIMISPILIVVAILIYLENPDAPILYKSKRVGKSNRLFNCLKFRSMVPDAEALKAKLLAKNERQGGVLFKMENDPRVTNIGQVLRKWSLDELPQIFNVLKGDMSLIGPRPHLPEEVEKYHKDDRRILSIKPGMTGFAQINGRSSLSLEEEMKFELFYMKNWTLWLDAIIFVKTIFIILKREHVS